MSSATQQPLADAAESDPLDAALRDARRLAELLDLEARALAARRPEQLMESSLRKSELAERLEGRSGLLRDYLQRAAGGRDARGQRLADLLRACRRRNIENGVLIGSLGRHTRRALALLSGRARADTVYGPSGQERIVSANRYTARA